MKKAKRIIAFALLIGIAFVLAYFVFTGKRFGRYPENAEALQGKVYVNEDETIVRFGSCKGERKQAEQLGAQLARRLQRGED